PRRVTRSSAKLAASPPPAPADDLALGSDIEDAITRNPRKRRRVANGSDDAAAVAVKPEPSSPPPAPSRPRRKPARRVKDAETGAVSTEPPSSWREIYDAVLEM